MDWDNLGREGKAGADGGNEREPNDKRISGKSFAVGLLAGVVAFTAACFAFPSINYSIGALRPSYGESADEARVQTKMNEIFRVLDTNYVDEYDKKTMLEGLYTGLVYGVGDPYTAYMSSSMFAKFLEETEGVYAGIGVSVSVDSTDNSIIVISPFEGYPGAEAGILPGDKILKVNGGDVSGDTMNEAIAMLKGEPGTTVDLTVYRPDTNSMIDMTVAREKISVPTVTHKLIGDDIAYIRITQFERVTYEQFKAAYDAVRGAMKGLIIDLRNNPGGLLKTVTDITDLLVPEGTIVYTEDKNGEKVYTKSDAACLDVPLLVLVNGYSASASEVLSGAVKDMGIGELVGSKTFGKGLVQNLFPLSDGSALKVTIAKYYTPSGVCIQGEGIAPDYPVEMDTALSVKLSTLPPEEDPQLSKAVEVMNQKLGRTTL